MILKKLTALARQHYLQKEGAGELSITHTWSEHILPTARLARRLARFFGAPARTAELAYIAGLLHDWERLKETLLAQKRLEDRHEVWSSHSAANVLSQFGMRKEEIGVVVRAIEGHSFGISVRGGQRAVKRGQRDLVGLCLFLADKLDQLLPSIIFRRNVYLGEALERFDFEKALAYWKRRMAKSEELLRGKEGAALRAFWPGIDHQFSFVQNYVQRLERRERDALEILKFCFEQGQRGVRPRRAMKIFFGRPGVKSPYILRIKTTLSNPLYGY